MSDAAANGKVVVSIYLKEKTIGELKFIAIVSSIREICNRLKQKCCNNSKPQSNGVRNKKLETLKEKMSIQKNFRLHGICRENFINNKFQ